MSGNKMHKKKSLSGRFNKKRINTSDMSELSITNEKWPKAQVSKAQVSKAQVTIEQVSIEQMSKAQVSIEQMSKAQVSTAQVSIEQMSKAQVSTAQVTKAQVTIEQMSKAQVSTAQVSTAQVTKAQVTKAQVTKAQVTKAQVTKAQVSTAQVTKAQVTKAQVTKAQVSKAQVSTAQVTKACNQKYNVYKLKKPDYETLSKSYLNDKTNQIHECKQRETIVQSFISPDEINRKYFDFFHNMSYQYSNLLNDLRLPPNMIHVIVSIYNWLKKIIYTFSSLHMILISQYYVKFSHYNEIVFSDISNVLSKNKIHLNAEYNLFFNPYDSNEKWFLPHSLLN
jgi:uncharacterized protein YjbI with pentapeptide repeats